MSEQITPVALVTGAGSGIGRAVARQLAAAGYRVVLAGRRANALEETAASLPEGCESLCIPVDVSDPGSGHVMVTTCLGRFGRLDVLVNNAGVAPLKPIDQTDAELIQQAFFTNSIGPACTIAAAWMVFRRQYAENRMAPRGHCIVNISTLGTLDPFPGFFAYAASKAGLNLMARSCAKEGAAIGVRAFAVAPGAVETPMLRANFPEKMIPRAKALAPEDVARVIAACVLGERDAENGQVIWVASP